MDQILISIQKTVEPAFQQIAVFLVELIIATIVFLVGWRITPYAQKVARRALYRRDPETAGRLFAAGHRMILIAG